MSLITPLILYREGLNHEADTLLFWRHPSEVGFFPTAHFTLLIRVLQLDFEDIEDRMFCTFGNGSLKHQEGYQQREWLYLKKDGYLDYRGSFENLGLMVRNCRNNTVLEHVKVQAKVSFVIRNDRYFSTTRYCTPRGSNVNPSVG
jgi:hypothetical protein